MPQSRPYLALLFIIIYGITTQAQTSENQLKSIPPGFIENKGQIIDQYNNLNPQVRFLMSGNGMNTQLRYNGFSYDLVQVTNQPKMTEAGPVMGEEAGEELTMHIHRIDFDLLSMNPSYTVETEGQSKEYFNYYTTGTPEEGVLDVRHYQKVTYKSIYPKIDLEFLAQEGKVKYNFIVNPGGRLSDIRFKVCGADRLTNEGKSLAIQTSQGELKEEIPFSFYEMNGEKTEVKAQYVSSGQNVFTIATIEKISSGAKLVIDPNPNRIWGTYYNGTGTPGTEERFSDIATTIAGVVYSAGITNFSGNIATTGAAQTTYGTNTDAMLVKFSTAGARTWATYYGGTGVDKGLAVGIAQSEFVWLGGSTTSTTGINFFGDQATLGGGTDGFLARFNSSGVRQSATYVGGSGEDVVNGISATTTDGNIFYVGTTGSTGMQENFSPQSGWTTVFQSTLGGSTDAYWGRISSVCETFYRTYFGGTGADQGLAISVSSAIQIVGSTASSTGIATSGAYKTTLGSADGFLASFSNSTGQRVWATYFGDNLNPDLISTVLDANNGRTYIGANAFGTYTFPAGNYQTTGTSSRKIVIASFNTGTGAIVGGTYFGAISGSINKIIQGPGTDLYFTCNPAGSGYATPGAYETTGSSGFIGRFRPNLDTLVWGTYYGGSSINSISKDNSSNLYICGHTSATTGIASTVAYQTTNNGTPNAFLVKFNDCLTPLQPDSISGSLKACANTGGFVYSITPVSGATSYTWSGPAGSSVTSGQGSTSATFSFGTNPGNISVTANNACGAGGAQTMAISFNTPIGNPTIFGSLLKVCQGSTHTFAATASGTFSANDPVWNWSAPVGASIATPTSSSTSITFGTTSGNVQVTVTNACGTTAPAIRAITVDLSSITPVITGPQFVCQNQTGVQYSTVASGFTPTWAGLSGATFTSTQGQPTASFNFTTGGVVSLQATNTCGTVGTTFFNPTIITSTPAQPGTISGPTTLCANQSNVTFSVPAVPQTNTYMWSFPAGVVLVSGAGTNSFTVNWGTISGVVNVVAQNGCGNSTSRQLSVSVGNAAPGAISGTTSVCQGSSNTYSISPVSGATSYTWTLPGGWSGSSTSNVIVATAGVSGGTISVVANTGCGASSPSTQSITVTSGIAAPTAGSNGPICAGTNLNLNASTVSGATYSWTGPNGFTSTQQNPTLPNAQTNASGTYSVIAIHGSCSSAVATTTVTVNAAPSTPTAFNNGPLCAGSTLQLTSVGVGSGSIVWSGPNGFSASMQNPQILNATSAASGMYSIFTIASGCSSAVANTVVTINPTPAAPAASSNSPVCAGGNLNLTASTVIGASYLWSGPNSFTSTQQNPTISSVASVEAGSYTVRAILAGCTSAINSTNVVVNETPAQPGPITGSATICSGASGSYSISTVAGATSYTWNLPSGWTGASTSTSINAAAGTNSGNISVTANNGCGASPSRTLAVSVNTIPTQPGTISGSPTVCTGASQTYSVSPVSGATVYNWTLPSGWSGSSTSASINTTAGSTSGNLTVSAGNTCGTSLLRTVAVTAASAPAQPSVITGSSTVCSGTAQTYSVTNATGVTYAWVASGGTVTGSGNSVSVTWTSTGSRTLTVTPSNACGTGTGRTLNVTVNSGTPPAQPSPITGDTASCPGNKTYSVTNDPSVTYSWTVSGGGTITGSGNSISVNWTSPGVHTLSCTPATTCGTGPSRNLEVNVRITPVQPNTINGNSAVCEGTSQTYTVDPVAGATSYMWILPSGWSGSSTTNTINSTASSGTGTITVTASNVCGNSPVRSLSVNGTALPAQPGAITGATSFCANGSANFSISPVSGAASYTWTLPSGWVGASTGTSLNPTVGTAGGTVSVISNNSCGSSAPRTLIVTVNSVPTQPGTISGTTNVCVGDNQVYSVAPVSGATVFNWTLPSGWTGTSTTNSITATPGAVSGNISVTAGNICGSSAARTLAVTTNSLPSQPSAITGTASVCSGVSTTYSVTSVSGVTYTWTLPSGWSGASTTNTINTIPGSSGGTLSVVANNLCGASTVRTFSVGAGTVPTQPGSISGNSTVCEGANQVYTVAAVSGATTYNWVFPSGWTGNSTTNSISVTAGSANGTLSVTASNTCGNSPARTLSISAAAAPAQSGTITGSTNVCSGTAQTYSVPSVAGVTYVWTASGGTVTGSGNSVTVTWTATGSRTLTVSPSNSCGTGPDRMLSVMVNTGTAPTQPSPIAGDSASCPGSKTYSVTNDPLVTYSWTVSSGGTITGSGNNVSVNWTTAGLHTLSCTPATTCGTGPSRNLTVNVRITPAQPDPINGNAAVCQGTSQTYSIDPVADATTYFWTLPGGWTGTSTTPSINATVGSGSGNLSVVAENVCGASSARSLAVTTTAIPAQPSTISGPAGGCNGSVRTFSVSPAQGVTYTWTLPSGWSGASTSNSITVTSGSSGGILSVSASNSCGNSSPKSLAVQVGSPNVSLSQNGDSLLAVQQTGASYQWLNCSTGLPIAGATGRAFVPFVSGTYAVVVTSNGCADTSTCLPVIITGLEARPAYAAPALYPMPVGDVLYIQNQWEEGSKVWMKLYDLQGHMIFSSEQSSETLMQLDLSELRNGAYVLELQNTKGTSRHKLSKIR
jgi:large repetitive protein